MARQAAPEPATEEEAPTPKEPQSAPFDASVVQGDVRTLLETLYSGGDPETLVDFVNPKLLKLMGGREGLRKVFAQSMETIRSAGMSLDSLKFPAEPVFFSGEKNDFALVQTLMVVQAPGARIESLNFQFGSREIGTEKWYYTEGSRLNMKNVGKMFPDYPMDRELPETYRKQL